MTKIYQASFSMCLGPATWADLRRDSLRLAAVRSPTLDAHRGLALLTGRRLRPRTIWVDLRSSERRAPYEAEASAAVDEGTWRRLLEDLAAGACHACGWWLGGGSSRQRRHRWRARRGCSHDKAGYSETSFNLRAGRLYLSGCRVIGTSEGGGGRHGRPRSELHLYVFEISRPPPGTGTPARADRPHNLAGG